MLALFTERRVANDQHLEDQREDVETDNLCGMIALKNNEDEKSHYPS